MVGWSQCQFVDDFGPAYPSDLPYHRSYSSYLSYPSYLQDLS